MLTFASKQSSAPPRWVAVPTPPEPYAISLGRARASATRSRTLLTGSDGFVTSTLGDETSWMTGVKEVVVHDAEHNRINKIGTRHECIRDDMIIDVITSHYELTDEGGMFSETAADQPMTCDYLVEKKNGKTLVTIFIHLAAKFPMSLFARLFMKKKMDQSLNMVLAGFKTYCENLSHKPVKFPAQSSRL